MRRINEALASDLDVNKSEVCALGELDRKEQIWSDFSKDMVMADLHDSS